MDASDPSFIPAAFTERVYSFQYELQFMSTPSKFEFERYVFRFKLLLFSEIGSGSSQFYQCTLPQVTYYVASGNFYYIQCLIAGNVSMNDASCSTMHNMVQTQVVTVPISSAANPNRILTAESLTVDHTGRVDIQDALGTS